MENEMNDMGERNVNQHMGDQMMGDQMGQMVGMPQMPQMPQMDQMYNMPQMGQMPQMQQMPQMGMGPQMGMMPQMSQMPQMSMMPQMPVMCCPCMMYMQQFPMPYGQGVMDMNYTPANQYMANPYMNMANPYMMDPSCMCNYGMGMQY